MIGRLELGDRQLESPLGRLGPLAKLSVAAISLLGLALTLDPRAPSLVVAVVVVAGLVLGRIPPRALGLRLMPFILAALGVGLFNAVTASALDPAGMTFVRVGPVRLTDSGALAGLGLGLRVLAVAIVGAVFLLTTDATRLVDALAQVARVPERFAYGAFAAYQAVPQLGRSLVALRQARRIRGLGGSWHPRLLVGLLVLAIRHADRLAVAMDARAFGARPRTRYRLERWTRGDTAFVLLAGGGLVAVLLGVRA